MKYNFSEKNLGDDFCKETVDEIRDSIQQGRSSTLLGMPLSGMVTFFRYLSTTNLAYFAYVDTQTLKYRTRNELFLSLYTALEGKPIQSSSIDAFEACKEQLRKLCLTHKRIVILVVRLDYLKEELATGLLTTGASLK